MSDRILFGWIERRQSKRLYGLHTYVHNHIDNDIVHTCTPTRCINHSDEKKNTAKLLLYLRSILKASYDSAADAIIIDSNFLFFFFWYMEKWKIIRNIWKISLSKIAVSFSGRYTYAHSYKNWDILILLQITNVQLYIAYHHYIHTEQIHWRWMEYKIYHHMKLTHWNILFTYFERYNNQTMFSFSISFLSFTFFAMPLQETRMFAPLPECQMLSRMWIKWNKMKWIERKRKSWVNYKTNQMPHILWKDKWIWG